ncbi:hypothetical protein HPP92_010622 [Vanilla planifolia]|uniref:Pentatricopeptide repeat-containing protein n=1 Tax=Vanilla planifolia TaxID=51239 RepID=A0A835QW19_VANPL|nr:hypothetical protein HPP92_010622 [Vanilla planifolia]
MVDLLGRAGLLEEAEELIASMPMEADVVIWGSMLASARTYQKVEFGEGAAEKLARLDPGHEAGRVLMSNIYADADRWDEVSLLLLTVNSRKRTAHSGNGAPLCVALLIDGIIGCLVTMFTAYGTPPFLAKLAHVTVNIVNPSVYYELRNSNSLCLLGCVFGA